GIYGQDQWTLHRLTLNLGLRFDYYDQSYRDVHLPPVQWVPIPRNFTAAKFVEWKDVEPRAGFAYDLFGTGKTAVKASIGRYVLQQGALTNPGRTNTSMRRTWTDPNGDYIILGDPLNPAANGELGSS